MSVLPNKPAHELAIQTEPGESDGEDIYNAFYEALDAMEPVITLEYNLAMAQVPWLVAQESKPMDFLRTENMHPHRAALRLALYWKYRHVFFGSQRWLLPMTQTGRGCLSTEDVEMLRTGVMLFVTRPNQGPIMFIDVSRMKATAGYSATRCLYYFVTVLTDEFLQTDGASVIKVVHGGYGNRPAKFTLDKQTLQCPLQALPWRIKDVAVAQSHEEGKGILIDTFGYIESRLLEFKSGFTPKRIASDSVKGVLLGMAKHGVNMGNTPQSLGGKLDYSQCLDNWIRMRITMEEYSGGTAMIANLSLLTGQANHASSCNIGNSDDTTALLPKKTKNQSNRPDRDDEDMTPVKQLPGESKMEFRRRRNAIYVKRNYHKTNNAICRLEKEVQQLKARKKTMQKENQRLESILCEARRLVALALENRSLV